MSSFSGPEISNDGLVFYYDMNNTEKSWRGKPTTNLLQSTDFTTGWQGYCGGTSNITYNTLDVKAPDESNTALKHVRGSETGCFEGASWGLLHVLASPMVTGQPHTISVWARTNGPTLGVTLGHNDSAGTGITLNSEWQRFSFTYTPGDTSRGFQFINSNLNTTTYWWRPQCEVNSFATPFVNGTRSNTQAILDLTNNNTITAQNLSYASDGTFSFDGTDDTIHFGNISSIFTGNLTVEAIVNLSAYQSDWVRIVGTGGNSGNRTFGLWYYTDGRLLWQRYGASDPAINPSNVLSPGTWYHIVATTSGSNHVLYLNNSIIGTATAAGPWAASGENVTVGFAGFHTYLFGSVPNIRLYNRALSAQEVAQNFQALRGRYGL
jgi:hypothetical protein